MGFPLLGLRRGVGVVEKEGEDGKAEEGEGKQIKRGWIHPPEPHVHTERGVLSAGLRGRGGAVS